MHIIAWMCEKGIIATEGIHCIKYNYYSYMHINFILSKYTHQQLISYVYCMGQIIPYHNSVYSVYSHSYIKRVACQYTLYS